APPAASTCQPLSGDAETPAGADRPRRCGARHSPEVCVGLAPLRSGVDVAPRQEPEGGLLIGRQVAGVDDVLDVREPLAATHTSLDIEPHPFDGPHGHAASGSIAPGRCDRAECVWWCALAARRSTTRSWPPAACPV